MSMIPSLYQPYLNDLFIRTTDLHDHFTNKKIFIAGGHGFYGSWLFWYFVHLSANGINVDIQRRSTRNYWDILRPSTYPDSQFEADFIVNAAGAACAVTERELLVHSNGSAALLHHRKEGAKLLHISTGAIAADTPYANAKRHAESLLQGQARVQIVRPFTTIGPGMPLDTHFAMAAFVKNAQDKLPLMVRPGIVRSYCHVVDLTAQILHVMIHGDEKPYEIGSDDPISLEDAANLISDQVMWSRHDFPSNAATDHYVCDLTRVRNQFNLDLTWNSRSAILDTWQNFKNKSSMPLA